MRLIVHSSQFTTMETFDVYLKKTEEVGFATHVVNFLVRVDGLPTVILNELVVFETGEFGRVLTIASEFVEILLFSKPTVKVGTRATRTKEFLEVAVGDGLLGKIITPLGTALNNKKPVPALFEKRQIDISPPGIEQRQRISRPLETGATLVDLIIPLGKGQRELVIGDRKTGKTSFLVQSILTQARSGSLCVYAAIGKKVFDIKKIEELFDRTGISKSTVIVASSLQDSGGIVHVTPYVAMTIAEYFKDKGKDVLVVLDDLSTHARFYREISLLANRFPGRNSYPGDIFYTHAKLLERAGNFKTEKGEAAITCLPIAEAIQGDLTGYVQTNLMSMTDGHIFFDTELFTKGVRPAVNTFLSVTRVGRQTQTSLKRDINRELVSFLTLYDRMQRFVHFGAELSESIKQTLRTGEKILVFFKQTSYQTLDPILQVLLFSLLWIGVWQERSTDEMRHEMEKMEKAYHANPQLQEKVKADMQASTSFNGYLNTLRKDLDVIIKQLLTDPAAQNGPVGSQVKPVQKIQKTVNSGIRKN